MPEPVTILMLLKRVDCVDGVAAYLETIIAGLSARGDRVVLLTGPVSTPDGSESRRQAIAASALDWVVMPGFDARRPSVALLLEIMRMVRAHDVAIVSPQGFAVLPIGVLAGRLTGRPVVANYHPSIHGDEVKSMTGRHSATERIAFRAVTGLFPADRFIALSRDIARFFRDVCRIPEQRIHEQVLGVETDYYRRPTEAERTAARISLGLASNTLVTVLPGRLNLSKGHDLVVEAVRSLAAARPSLDIVCLFPGSGSQRGVIEASAIRDDADRARFRFLGFVARDTLRDCYWAADIVLLPSRMEGFGLVVAEAMCCGAIVIRTPSGGWQDQVIEGVTGFVVPFNDAPAVASVIARLADDTNRSAMRDAAMAHAMERFDKTRMVEGTSALYRGLAARSTRGRRLARKAAR